MKRLLSILLIVMVVCPVFSAYAADPVLVETITLNESSVMIPIKKGIRLKTTIEPKNVTNKKLTWSSSDESVATVKDGQVNAVGVGKAIITVTAEDGSNASASAEVTVVIPVKKITLSESRNLPLARWVSWKLSAAVEPYEASILDVEWSSSNENIATVDQNGVVTGIAPGTAKITATAVDGSKVSAAVNVKVAEYDLVFTDKKSQNVTYSYGSGYIIVTGSVKTGCVRIPKIDTSILALIGRDVHEENVSVTPVKPGEDLVKISTGKKTFTYKVFVSPEAFPSSDVAPQDADTENDEPHDILFLNIPWGSSYDEANTSLRDQGKRLKPAAVSNGSLRAMVDGEVAFSNLTAFRAAVNLAFEEGDPNYKKNNSLFMGDFYFDPEIPFEQIQLAVRNVYGLDKGNTAGDVCTWKQGNIQLTLTKKEKFTCLEIRRNDAE